MAQRREDALFDQRPRHAQRARAHVWATVAVR
jgi:hypothetical protein